LTLAIGLAVLLSTRRAIFQTTLAAAWWWTLAALAAWSSIEIVAANAGAAATGPSFAAFHFAALALSFCPIVALIGAKRPQHAAWNFVVLALWCIVALPAAEAIFSHGRVLIGFFRGLFLGALILLLPVNFVPTRYWPAALLVAAGQTLGLSPQLHVVGQSAVLPYVRLIAPPTAVGLLLCSLGLFTAWALSRGQRKTALALDLLWLDFRDSLGLFWSLRVQERINALTKQHGWDLELAWSGFRRKSSNEPLPSIEPSIERTLRISFKGLLRRFVSSAWIAARLDAPPK
jgi:hypothetical protein